MLAKLKDWCFRTPNASYAGHSIIYTKTNHLTKSLKEAIFTWC